MKKALIAAAAFAALITVALVLSRYEARQASRVAVPANAEAVPSPQAGFSFIALEQPRPLPEIHFSDGDGQALTMADFRGRLVLLNIWATWCGPCRREMPALDRLQAKLGAPEFEVVALSIDRNGLPVVKAFYQELGLETLRIYVDQSGKALRDLNVIGVPTTLLIDQVGAEIGRTVGPAEWDSAEVVNLVRRYLKEPTAAREHGVPAPTASREAAAIDQPRTSKERKDDE